MARLYSDLLKTSGQRYYFGLDSAPGIVSPGIASLTLIGLTPINDPIVQVFRSPATAVLTLIGVSLSSQPALSPAAANLSLVGQAPARALIRVITPATPTPDYSALPDNAPTILTEFTVTPTAALLPLLVLEQNVTQGGNIGFVAPAPASISLQTRQFTLVFFEVGAGTLTILGQVPVLVTGLTIEPSVGALTASQLAPALTLPFHWVDDDPAPAATWINDRAA